MIDPKMCLPIGTVLWGESCIYRIQKVLGSGSFGITYLADVELKGALGSLHSNTQVAIKEFFMKEINGREGSTVTSSNKGGVVDDYRRKFRREAANLAKLNHPDIVKVLESFDTNGTSYYVMEYIDGMSLDKAIERKGRLGEAQSLAIMRHVCTAVSYMHKNKMLHLDIKPGNIMLRSNGDAVLIDFGLSKQYDDKGQPETSTTIGSGTPGYAPIEQANYRESKDFQDFPETMDVYALGGTLFKMLTGHRPPNASEILNYGFPWGELKQHGVSDGMINVISHAMAPMTKDRIQTVSELARRLQGLGHHSEETETDDERTEWKNGTTWTKPNDQYRQTRSQTTDEPVKPAPKPKRFGWQTVTCISAAVIAIVVIVIMAKSNSENNDKPVAEEKWHQSPVNDANASDYVDFGLSVKWATCNLGASSPEEYGDYYAWAETSPRTISPWNYDWNSTPYCLDTSGGSWSKYTGSDGKTVLDPEDDAATIALGSPWRMPTFDEIKELLKKCKWTWTTMNGKNGYKVVGPNGNSIFLPAAGYRFGTSLYYAGTTGSYWSSSLNTSSPDDADYLDFDSGYHDWGNYGRYNGQSVRPVRP